VYLWLTSIPNNSNAFNQPEVIGFDPFLGFLDGCGLAVTFVAAHGEAAGAHLIDKPL
jgi:hypothetical protein